MYMDSDMYMNSLMCLLIGKKTGMPGIEIIAFQIFQS